MANSIIGLTGGSGAGKTSLARALHQHYCYAHLGFADPVRAAVAAAVRETTDRIFSHPFKDLPHPRLPGGTTPRALAICWAEAARRDFGDRFWVEHLAMRATQYGPRVVIDDVRFQVEADWINANGGIVVAVGPPPNGLRAGTIAMTVSSCPAEPEARQAWLEETSNRLLAIARRSNNT